MTVQDVKTKCQQMHADKTKSFSAGCKACEFWTPQRGCNFYNRPLDWRLNKDNEL